MELTDQVCTDLVDIKLIYIYIDTTAKPGEFNTAQRMPLHLVQTLFVPATYFLVASSLHWAELLLIVRPWMCYKKSAVPQSAETERRYHLAIWSLTWYRFWIWHMSPHGLLLKRPSWISYHSMSNVWERLWGPSAVHHGCHSLRCRWCSQHVGLVKRGT